MDEDTAFLLRLRQLTMDPHHAKAGISQSLEESLSRVRADFHCARIIERAGQPVGMIKVLNEQTALRIQQLQLLPAFQGQGIGTQVIIGVLDLSKSQRKRATLSVLHANPARRLYERLGFRVVGRDELSLHMESEA